MSRAPLINYQRLDLWIDVWNKLTGRWPRSNDSDCLPLEIGMFWPVYTMPLLPFEGIDILHGCLLRYCECSQSADKLIYELEVVLNNMRDTLHTTWQLQTFVSPVVISIVSTSHNKRESSHLASTISVLKVVDLFNSYCNATSSKYFWISGWGAKVLLQSIQS